MRPGDTAVIRRERLNPEVEDIDAVREILKFYDTSLTRHYPVNQRVNSVQNDDAECAAPITSKLQETGESFLAPKHRGCESSIMESVVPVTLSVELMLSQQCSLSIL
jgi:hypothetical protein